MTPQLADTTFGAALPQVAITMSLATRALRLLFKVCFLNSYVSISVYIGECACDAKSEKYSNKMAPHTTNDHMKRFFISCGTLNNGVFRK